jgi:hypothetical protein
MQISQKKDQQFTRENVDKSRISTPRHGTIERPFEGFKRFGAFKGLVQQKKNELNSFLWKLGKAETFLDFGIRIVT